MYRETTEQKLNINRGTTTTNVDAIEITATEISAHTDVRVGILALKMSPRTGAHCPSVFVHKQAYLPNLGRYNRPNRSER